MDRELRERMAHLQSGCAEVRKHRETVLNTYSERLKSRLQEWLASSVDQDRIVQEAALLADRSDIQEELVRLENHVQHFLGLLDAGGEVGKKLDFLLQEMNREANTLLSKTSGLAGDAVRITEAGLAMKSDIEKAREQVQNIKSTLVNVVRRTLPNLEFSISYTTRQPRGREKDGCEYFFISREQFEGMIQKNEFLEHAKVFESDYYGTACRFLRHAEQNGNDLLLDIDVQGAEQVKTKIPDAVSVFIMPPNRAELERRLRERSQDSEPVIQKRLKAAGERPPGRFSEHSRGNLAFGAPEAERAGR